MPASEFLVEFGATVRRLRERRSLTQAQLAARVGLGRTSVTNLERGKQNPPLSLLPELARALGVSASDLVSEASVSPAAVDHSVLAGQVRDDNLRRWASQVIGDRAPARDNSKKASSARRKTRGES